MKLFAEFCESTTGHGLNHIYSANTKCGKAFWCVITAVFFVFLTNVCIRLGYEFSERETITEV